MLQIAGKVGRAVPSAVPSAVDSDRTADRADQVAVAVRGVVGAAVRPAAGRAVATVVAAPVELPVDRFGVRTGAVFLRACARAAGCVRFDRSGRLITSHGSRLFEGEGPTGEDNAARAAGPPTG
ncbi:hypothetical protein AB0O91_27200 [Kitasatospora sp. NPDC089797]|uniref:hypothetical protein n=1 Tax=Kitasatospora sp. NPDC089797 TaxID=3155298 RepID=UPI00343F0028